MGRGHEEVIEELPEEVDNRRDRGDVPRTFVGEDDADQGVLPTWRYLLNFSKCHTERCTMMTLMVMLEIEVEVMMVVL